MTRINMVDALNLALKQEMTKDKSVMVLGEDVGKEGGVFRVTSGLQKEFGEDRAVDTPLAESGIVGTSIGLSINGMKPVCEMQFSGFVYPGFDQIICHAARMRNRSRGTHTTPMVVRMPYSGGIRALEHHSESMEALFMHIPGIKVVIPSTPYNAKGLLISAIRDPDTVIFMEPKRVYRAIKEEVSEDDYIVPLGKASIVQEGSDLTIISYGAMLRECKKAIGLEHKKSEKPKPYDYSVELIDLQTISPLDTETIIKSVKKTGRCVIVHEGPRTGGVAAEIIARINEHAILSLKAPVERVTGFDTVIPLYRNEMRYLPSPFRINKSVEKVMKF